MYIFFFFQGSLAARIFEQIRIPETQMKSWKNDRCEVCCTDLTQLKREAVAMVNTLEESQFLAYYNIPGYVVGPNAEQLIRRADKQRLQMGVTMDTSERNGMTNVKPEETGVASSFLSRAAQKLLSSKKKKKGHSHKQETTPTHPSPAVELTPARPRPKEVHPYPYPTNFKEVLRLSSLAVPPGLLKMHTKRTDGKVKVMLRIGPSFPGETGSFMKVDQKRRQVTLYDPSTVGHVSQTHRKMGVAAPKMFAFDSIFESDCSQVEVCSGSLVDVLQAVVGGSEGCLFSYGHAGLGKTHTMVGRDEKEQALGLIPCALSWLFKLIADQKQKTGTKFSVRVSAVEIVGRSETVRDLLAEQASGSENGMVDPSPSVFLKEDRNGGAHEINPTELRAPTADKAAFYLDAALSSRTKPLNGQTEGENSGWEEKMNSHMFFTVHIYQYRVEKNSKNVGGGSKKDGGASSMSLSGLGNVIISLINGAKHVPHRSSKITRMLLESIGNTSCRTTMIAHVSPSLPFYTETLATVHLASRLHRLRKRKGKGSGTSSSGGESSCDEARIRKPRLRTAEPRLRTTALNEKLREHGPIGEQGSSDYNSSTGEESCDTVIYVGPDGAISDRELTDNEGPPARLPVKNSAVSISTRSLVRKLESIENEEAEDQESSLVREVEGEEGKGNVEEGKTQAGLLSEREEGEGSEDFTEDSCYETEIEIAPENRGGTSRKRLLDKTNSSWSSLESSQVEVKRSKKYQSDSGESSRESDLNSSSTDNNTLIVPSSLGSNLELDQSMTSHSGTIVIPVQSFPGEDAKLRTRVMSPETSSESSDAESIVMAKVPSFSFLTCEAVNVVHTDSVSMESLNVEQDLRDYELSRYTGSTSLCSISNATGTMSCLESKRDYCDAEVSRHFENAESCVKSESTTELIKKCLPPSPTADTNELCYVVEETRETSSEELSYDDSEIVWGRENADHAIIAEAFSEDGEEQEIEDDDSQRNFTGTETDVLFPELEQRLQDISACVSPEPSFDKSGNHKPSHRAHSDDSATDSDTDVPRSLNYETPLKTFYRLVPSPQSSSTEDELEDIQMSKSFQSSKTLSPIPEFPSVESNLNRASLDSERDAKHRASCSYSIISVEIDDGNSTVVVEGNKENVPLENLQSSSSKGDLRSLLQKFVAEQLRECEGRKFSSWYARPDSRNSENRRPRSKQNRRVVPLASCDSSNNEKLLPPLVPQKRTYTETAKLVSSPKLRYKGERDYDSDNSPCHFRRQDADELSDGSMTAKTEPWMRPQCGVSRQQFGTTTRLTSLSVGNVKTSVMFLGSEDENNNFRKANSLEEPCVIEDGDNSHNAARPETPYYGNGERRDQHVETQTSANPNKRERLSSVSSFVKLTYCGSELSDAEFVEKPDKPSVKDTSSIALRTLPVSSCISVSVQKPRIDCIPLTPETPYAPQEQFIARFHDRGTPPRVIYRLSGEFVATIPSDSISALNGAEDAVAASESDNRHCRLSGEFVATFTTAADTSNASTLALTSSYTEESSKKAESTEVVWVQNEPVVSSGEVTADELSCSEPPVPTRSGKFGKFKFFSRDRSSFSSGHASDMSSRSDAASSSGYESMRNDASHASSDSCSERGFGRGKRKGVIGRSRSASPGNGSRIRKYSPKRWFSRKSLEPVQIKVYEVDDMERVQKAMDSDFQWQVSEDRKSRIASLRQRQRDLKDEFTETKQRLLEEQKRWSYGLKAEKELSVEDPKFINALEEENKKLEQRITVFKSNIMMVTSFDAVTTQV
ncbi:Kinesin-like protein KIF26A [Acropora cervicornis]|uniref:Kinesin-like protein KIF26A n=1 Tax=Acropora cervicornis TaxID=6130 RepID=A0AAD9QHV1_ACRCE|nr:Kinesin-like protein KIF26A [Acropora cervicornis]